MADDKAGKGPVSGGKRFLKLAGMTASMAGRYAGHRLSQSFRAQDDRRSAQDDFHRQAGEDLARSLGELKGAAMKLGQFASQLSDFLPEELSAPLQRLQKDAPPMPFAVIRQQIEAELGSPPEELFAELDAQPYAAASIGQVHYGRLHDGTEVVIKVQYPGVAASCDSDLRQLRRALQAARLIKVDKQALDEVFAEIRERLHEELDYLREADNLRQARQLFSDNTDVAIPQVVDSHSSSAVLTMQCLAGQPLNQAAGDQKLANALGLKLFHFLSSGLFQHGFVHADPNPANFAYDESGRLIVYDFGCVKQVPQTIINAYRDAVQSAMQQDWSQLDHALMRLGVRIPGSPRLPDRFYTEWHAIVMQPFVEDADFDFGSSTLHKVAIAKSAEVMPYMDRLQPQAQTLFIDRVISGHYWTLVKLGAQLNLHQGLLPYLRNS